MPLTHNEHQIELWVRSYPGISEEELVNKKLDYELHVRDTLNALVRKQYIRADDTSHTIRYYSLKYIDIPEMELIHPVKVIVA